MKQYNLEKWYVRPALSHKGIINYLDNKLLNFTAFLKLPLRLNMELQK